MLTKIGVTNNTENRPLCYPYGNLFERDKCPANKPFSEVNKSVGLSGSLYVGLGGEFSITCDVEKMMIESEEILSGYKLF